MTTTPYGLRERESTRCINHPSSFLTHTSFLSFFGFFFFTTIGKPTKSTPGGERSWATASSRPISCDIPLHGEDKRRILPRITPRSHRPPLLRQRFQLIVSSSFAILRHPHLSPSSSPLFFEPLPLHHSFSSSRGLSQVPGCPPPGFSPIP